MPSILIETAFITNINNAYMLENKQDDIAQAIFKGINDYLGLGVVTLTKEQAKEKLSKFLSADTIKYLDSYRYGDELIIKLAENMK